MTNKDRDEFKQFLRQCTDKQVHSVLEKEETAGRDDYADLARSERDRRGLWS